jgi:hypothetical protein
VWQKPKTQCNSRIIRTSQSKKITGYKKRSARKWTDLRGSYRIAGSDSENERIRYSIENNRCAACELDFEREVRFDYDRCESTRGRAEENAVVADGERQKAGQHQSQPAGQKIMEKLIDRVKSTSIVPHHIHLTRAIGLHLLITSISPGGLGLRAIASQQRYGQAQRSIVFQMIPRVWLHDVFRI